MSTSPQGPLLEARAQRLFLAQGSFAERGLLPSATVDRRMLATDIDVLVSEYVSGFHLTRRHVECKSGRYSLLDRVLWLNGLRSLLRADSSYLIAADVDLDAAEFARGLDVQLFTLQHLDAWERSLGIPADVWPCRSDAEIFDQARALWRRTSSDREADDSWQLLRTALAYIEVESWLTFRYRNVNKLFRLIGEIVARYNVEGFDRDRELCARYVFSALLVRLAQHVLSICADVGTVLPADLDRYLTARLTYGDQDPNQAAELVRATLAWVQRALDLKGLTLPSEIDSARLHASPGYAAEVVQLVRRVLGHSHEARYLPLAVERLQFGTEADDRLMRFRAAATSADSLAALLKAVVVRTLLVPPRLAEPVRADLATAYRSPSKGASTGRTGRGSGRHTRNAREKPSQVVSSSGASDSVEQPVAKEARKTVSPATEHEPPANAVPASPTQPDLLPPDEKAH